MGISIVLLMLLKSLWLDYDVEMKKVSVISQVIHFIFPLLAIDSSSPAWLHKSEGI